MKELIQLLNLYQEERKSQFKFSSYDYNSSAFIIEKSPKMVLGEETIISKKFGFVQWLIENNKIKDPLLQVLKDIDLVGNDTITGVDVYSTTDSLLMLLSIKDEPIEFLIFVLK